MAGPNVKRRTFLKTAVTASAAPAVAAASAQAVRTRDKRYRLAIIGVGRRGRSNLRSALQVPELDVVAICDVYRPNIDLALKMVPEARVYDDFRDVLAADDIDAVCLGTPDHWHAYMTVEACKAGKDVLRRETDLGHGARRPHDGRGGAQVQPNRAGGYAAALGQALPEGRRDRPQRAAGEDQLRPNLELRQ